MILIFFNSIIIFICYDTGFATLLFTGIEHCGFMATHSTSRIIWNEYDSFELYQNDIAELDIRTLQLDTGSTKITHQELVLDDLRVWRWSTNRRMDTTIAYPAGWVSIGIALQPNTSEFTWCGIRPPANSMAIIRSGREHHFVEPAGWRAIEICMPEALLISRGIISAEILDQSMAPELGLFSWPSAYAYHMRHWLNSLFFAAAGEQTRLDSAHSFRLKEKVLNKIAEAMAIATEITGHNTSPKPLRQYALVRKAQSYINDCANRAISLNEICQTVGTTPRTLQRSFLNVLGVSPYQYAMKTRLTQARSELSRYDESKNVTNVAIRYGFCSTSEFSAHYKKHFGQLPSDKLRET